MKTMTKKIKSVIWAFLIAAVARADFQGPNGAMNVYGNNAGVPGDYIFYSLWGLNDLRAITTNNVNFELLPNINAYNENDPFWSDGAGDGNKFMDAVTSFDIPSITNEIGATFRFTVDTFDLDSRYILKGFLRIQDPSDEYNTVELDEVVITNTGTFTLSIPSQPTYLGMVMQAGWSMFGLNANPADEWGSATVTLTELTADTGDLMPPSPDPMTFDTLPYALSDQTISMTATTAMDEFPVQYYFACTNDAAFDSGWQSSPTYEATGLAAATEYTFTVTARDLSTATNTTDTSAAAAATTHVTDNVQPSPDPMQFAFTPEAGPVAIRLTAVSAVDSSPVQYYFACISGGGSDSGWQSSPVYIDSGLEPASNYVYTVSARDLSAATNVTAASDPVLVTTPQIEQWMVKPLTGYSGDTTDEGIVFDLSVDSLEYGSISEDPISAIAFGVSGATFGAGADYFGRNVLRTLWQQYADSSFEAYATFVLNGTVDQAAFMGMGQGIVAPAVSGNFGVPELALAGVNGIVAEFKTELSNNPNHKGCNMLKVIDGVDVETNWTGPVGLTDTFRVRLVHDAGAGTVTVSVDENYAGGEFVEDRTLGTYDTLVDPSTSMWEGAPVRVYAGGGEGTVVKDFMIRAFLEDAAVQDLSIAAVAGPSGAELSWTALAGQTYDLWYKTDLQTPVWTLDPSPGCSNLFITASGTLSVTSAVNANAVFYVAVPK